MEKDEVAVKQFAKTSHAGSVQRWISWLLKVGHYGLHVDITGEGWVRLDALVEAMSRDRPEWAEYDPQKLQALLEDTDGAGRFEIEGGRLRRVPSGARCPRVNSSTLPAPGSLLGLLAPTEAVEGSCSPERSRRLSRSTSCSSTSSLSVGGKAGSHHSEEMSTTASEDTSAQPFFGVADCTDDVAVGLEADVSKEAEKNQPAFPSVDLTHWTKYNDDGEIWWYYEGPLGKWYYTKHDDGDELREYED